MVIDLLKKTKTSLKAIRTISNWHLFFLHRLGLIKGTVIYKFRNGAKLRLKTKSDIGCIGAVWFHRDDYTPKDMEIKKGDIIIDVGAHIGAFSLYAATRAKNVKVHSYEPFKKSFDQLKKNIQLNNLQKLIKIFNLGVYGKKGPQIFYIKLDHVMDSSLFIKNEQKEIINCTTLKDIFNSNKIKKCNFLKMDCEGAEFEILYNTPKEYLKKIHKIAMEYHDIDKKNLNHKQLKKFLEQNNFKVIIKKMDEKSHFLETGMMYAINTK